MLCTVFVFVQTHRLSSVCAHASATMTVDLEGRLELAAAEVTQMRDVIGQMAKRLDARDKAVSAQIQVGVYLI